MAVARVLVNDPTGLQRWVAGELGFVLANDFPEKYAYKLCLLGTVSREFRGHVSAGPRIYYFYADEINIEITK